MDVDTSPAAAEVDLANALDLSESEEEEEMEDLVEDFARATTSDDVVNHVLQPVSIFTDSVT